MIDDKYKPMGEKAYVTLWDAITLLEEMGIRPILAFGTLLGIYRDKKLISHDWDIDFSIISTEVNRFDGRLAQVRGWKYIKIKQDLPKWKNETEESKELLVRTISMVKNGIRVDIDPVYLAKNGVDGLVLKGRKREKFVAKFKYNWFTDPVKIKDKWKGVYYAPKDVEEYLRLNYDNWLFPAQGHRDWKSRECRCDYYEI